MPNLLVDQGDADQFLDEQLKTHLLREACAAAGMKATIRMQPGYDHSYYFISTFMDEHIRRHAARLRELGARPYSRGMKRPSGSLARSASISSRIQSRNALTLGRLRFACG